MRGSRPPAGLQLLWTWSCSLTEGMPVTSITWNSANTNLIAAGYRANPAAAAAAAEAEAAGRPPGSAGSSSSSAGRPATAARSIRESMKIGVGAGEDAGAAGASAAAAAAAEVAGITGGRVALWSLKNQLHPIWTFETKSGGLAYCLFALCMACCIAQLQHRLAAAIIKGFGCELLLSHQWHGASNLAAEHPGWILELSYTSTEQRKACTHTNWKKET